MFVYLAIVMDLNTREIIGHTIGRYHSVLSWCSMRLRKRSAEARCRRSFTLIRAMSTTHFMPGMALRIPHHSLRSHLLGENGHQESFFGRFKKELGDLRRFNDLDELVVGIPRQITYYNTQRTPALKMTPRQKYEEARTRCDSGRNNRTHLSTSISEVGYLSL